MPRTAAHHRLTNVDLSHQPCRSSHQRSTVVPERVEINRVNTSRESASELQQRVGQELVSKRRPRCRDSKHKTETTKHGEIHQTLGRAVGLSVSKNLTPAAKRCSARDTSTPPVKFIAHPGSASPTPQSYEPPTTVGVTANVYATYHSRISLSISPTRLMKHDETR